MHGFAITNATDDEMQACAGEINRWLAEGQLKGRIDRVLPLPAAAGAHRLVETGAHLAGKIVQVP